MSRENVEALRRWVDGYNRRDVPAMVALSTPDIEFRSIFAGIESGGVFRGYSGIGAYFAALDEAYERFALVPHEFVDAGAAVVMVATAHWTGKESGATAATPIFPAAWMRAAKVFRVETFAERADALAAVGLDETAAG